MIHRGQRKRLKTLHPSRNTFYPPGGEQSGTCASCRTISQLERLKLETLRTTETIRFHHPLRSILQPAQHHPKPSRLALLASNEHWKCFKDKQLVVFVESNTRGQRLTSLGALKESSRALAEC